MGGGGRGGVFGGGTGVTWGGTPEMACGWATAFDQRAVVPLTDAKRPRVRAVTRQQRRRANPAAPSNACSRRRRGRGRRASTGSGRASVGSTTRSRDRLVTSPTRWRRDGDHAARWSAGAGGGGRRAQGPACGVPGGLAVDSRRRGEGGGGAGARGRGRGGVGGRGGTWGAGGGGRRGHLVRRHRAARAGAHALWPARDHCLRRGCSQPSRSLWAGTSVPAAPTVVAPPSSTRDPVSVSALVETMATGSLLRAAPALFVRGDPDRPAPGLADDRRSVRASRPCPSAAGSPWVGGLLVPPRCLSVCGWRSVDQLAACSPRGEGGAAHRRYVIDDL